MLSIQSEIEARVRAITEAHPDWPCRKGCDSCCRRLAEIPQLTVPEMELLSAGMAALPESVRAEIKVRLAQLELSKERPIVCPFLDLAERSCLVYEYRPVACRTYGFYVERDKGLYCEEIRVRVDSGEFADVVWGNACGIDAKLQGSRQEGWVYTERDV